MQQNYRVYYLYGCSLNFSHHISVVQNFICPEGFFCVTEDQTPCRRQPCPRVSYCRKLNIVRGIQLYEIQLFLGTKQVQNSKVENLKFILCIIENNSSITMFYQLQLKFGFSQKFILGAMNQKIANKSQASLSSNMSFLRVS